MRQKASLLPIKRKLLRSSRNQLHQDDSPENESPHLLSHSRQGHTGRSPSIRERASICPPAPALSRSCAPPRETKDVAADPHLGGKSLRGKSAVLDSGTRPLLLGLRLLSRQSPEQRWRHGNDEQEPQAGGRGSGASVGVNPDARKTMPKEEDNYVVSTVKRERYL